MEHGTTESKTGYDLTIENGDELVVDGSACVFVSETGTGLVNIEMGWNGDGETVSMPVAEFEEKLEAVHIRR